MMKKIYLFLMVLCTMNVLQAQTIVFGSGPFETRLLQSGSSNGYARDINGNGMVVDTNHNNHIEVSEAINVYALDLGNVTPLIYNLAGIEHFTNLRWLNLYASRVSGADLSVLTHLEELYANFMGIFVSGINIAGLDLKVLECSLTSAFAPYFAGNGLSQFPHLERLACSGNDLTSLDVSGLSELKYLNCGSNDMTSLNLSGLSHLEELYCENGMLSSLNISGCTALVNLQATNNKLTGFAIDGFPNLENIGLTSNSQLTNLSVSNVSSLLYMNANTCALTSFTISGAPMLQTLSCEDNQLTTFDCVGFPNLEYFSIYNNQLASLSFSDCGKLSSMSCYNNNLISLDISACSSLSNFNCSDNNLSTLLIKNGKQNYFQSMNAVDFANNPNLVYICADDNEMDGIQVQATGYGYTNCTVNGYCSFVPGGIYSTVQGSHKFDANSNGCEATDPVFHNLKFKITSGATTGYAISGASGNYTLPFANGSYTITPEFENGFFFANPASRSVSFPAAASPVTQDFCITTFGEFPDLEVSILPTVPARPGFDATYKIVYRNKGNMLQSGTLNLSFDDALLDLVGSIPPVSAQSTNNLSWNFSNMMPFEDREILLTLNVNSPVETPPANSGTLLAFNAAISSTPEEISPQDNHFAYNQYVVNSFDPNDKTCVEGDVVSLEKVGDYVHYIIRFENTGTFAAENIVVKDVINTAQFDLSSLVPLTGSHPYRIRIINPNKVEFIFENINLPFDNANNDGYVAFKIKTKETLAVGDTFSNSASIFFDYNAPIVTETATTTIAVLAVKDFEFADYITIYPNPANGVLNIQPKANITIASIDIYNTLGQLVLAVTNAKDVAKIDVSALARGNYFIRINSDKGSSNARFIKN